MNEEPTENLNQKELAFCRLVAQGKAPIQAAIDAGYAKGAYANKLMQKEKILLEIAKLRPHSKEVDVAKNQEILKFLTSIMRGDEYEECKDSMMKDRMRAAELLGKRLKLFEDLKQEPEPSVVIIDDINRQKADREQNTVEPQ